jgi:hypothetical protein
MRFVHATVIGAPSGSKASGKYIFSKLPAGNDKFYGIVRKIGLSFRTNTVKVCVIPELTPSDIVTARVV